MQKTKILAVAPYEGMADILTDIAQSRDDIALTVQTGDLFTGRDIAMQLAHKNYDVIISRGGTAELIQSAVELPVIDISISVYDILLSIKLAETTGIKFRVAIRFTLPEAVQEILICRRPEALMPVAATILPSCPTERAP